MKIPLRAGLLAGLALVWPAVALADPLTLDEAVHRAITASPGIAAREAGVRSAQAGRAQADVRPNPVLSVEAENFAGTGPFSVLNQPETTVTYAQTIERGGKREARVAFAQSDIAVARASARLARLEIAEAVERAFVDAQIAQEVTWLAQQRLTTEHQLQTEAVRRVRGYRDPLFVETQALARVTEAQLALAEAQARQAAAQAHLASFWGDDGDTIELPRGIERPDRHDHGLADADTALATAAIDRAQAAVTVEQTLATQDYTVSGGLRHLRESGDFAVLAGISIPLGRYDRNQGNIDRARAERERIEWEAEAARLEGLRQLANLRAEAEAARLRADGIMQDVYPHTQTALAQVREGYNRGGFRFSDVQDAADAINEVQAQWVEAMTRYRDVLSRIDRLTGRFDAVAGEELP